MLIVKIHVSGARGIGKTYVLDCLSKEIDFIRALLPGRRIQLHLSEENINPVRNAVMSRILKRARVHRS